jgi:hypothetical protein
MAKSTSKSSFFFDFWELGFLMFNSRRFKECRRLRAPTTLLAQPFPVLGNLEQSEAETSRVPHPLVVEHSYGRLARFFLAKNVDFQ